MPHDVFNAEALLFGCGVMLLCLAVQAITVVLVMNPVKMQASSLVKRKRHLVAQLVFFGATVLLLLSHLAQVYIWGLSFNLAGIIENDHEAMLFAGSTYTTVGFVDDPLAQKWQLAAIIMATNGFFSFAWSTSAMFGLSRILYPGET